MLSKIEPGMIVNQMLSHLSDVWNGALTSKLGDMYNKIGYPEALEKEKGFFP